VWRRIHRATTINGMKKSVRHWRHSSTNTCHSRFLELLIGMSSRVVVGKCLFGVTVVLGGLPAVISANALIRRETMPPRELPALGGDDGDDCTADTGQICVLHIRVLFVVDVRQPYG